MTLLFLLSGPLCLAVEYKDSEYVIPENETPGIIRSTCDEDYVPVHSRELLERVQDWAVGGVLRMFAGKAGFIFESEAYLKDNPHQGLFNFGFATGTQCLERDVTSTAVSVKSVLSTYWFQSKKKGLDHFVDKYIELVELYGFEQYFLCE